MRYGRTLILLAMTVACCIGIFVMTSRQKYMPNIVLQNDIAETVRENMNGLAILEEKFPDTDILVFDTEGFCIYPGGENLTLTKSRNNGYLCLAVTDGDRFLATAAIPDSSFSEYNKAFAQLTCAAVMLFLIMVTAAVSFYLYISRNILKPFRKMKEFAGRIAMGDLDSPLEMEHSNLFGAFTESFDIMREELRASKARETELKRKEKELVAELSHDLKTPITGINTICDVLSLKVQDKYVLGKVEGIQKKTQQMELLVTDLLTAALDDLGEMTVNCTDENAAVLYDIIRAADTRSLVRKSTIPECMIHIDIKRMEQVIGNIIGNSYKYADTPIDIECALSGDYLKLSITDYGKGVPADELDLIMNKFYRGKNVKDSDIDGSGLGLYIALALMAKMNGELICSSKGKGLTVTLMLLLS
ncbi:MAG: HAMP domain-containing histidine kinase [Lachnospiraceae bacterium]|nr:HAMP domain-containing histidine kinase [Lachnospiraceae bacterium]